MMFVRIVSFIMLSGDDFWSKSGIIWLIWLMLLMNACLCTEYLLHWKKEWISSSTLFELHEGHNLFSLSVNDLFGTKILSFITMS